MFDFTSNVNLFVQAFIAIIILGSFYNLWMSTKIYGGSIGKAIRFLGVGMMFVSISMIERILINFGIIHSDIDLALAQDILSLFGLMFLGLGFSKLASVAKS